MKRKCRVVAIIQARMGSTRFPGKVLADINGHPMLWHVVNRVSKAKTLDEVVVATSENPKDAPIYEFCKNRGIKCYRGSEIDVLDRYYQTAKMFNAEVVVRITADCPLIDPKIIDKMVELFLEGDYDYVTNSLVYSYPDGMDVEVFSFSALEKAWNDSLLPSDREHVTLYIRKSGKFRILNVENKRDLSHLRLTVDEVDDLELIKIIYSKLYKENELFGLEEIIELIEKEPEIMKLNSEIIRNEGYYRSLVNNPPVPPKTPKLKLSYDLKKKAQKLIPSCTQTFSKGPTQFVQGVSPVFLSRGQGSHVWDVDDNEYIDYTMALGPVILGYNYPAVTEAVIKQIKEGTTFSLPHPLEVEVAELLCQIIPCAEMVRFGKNGSDATSGAVRLARAYTGRKIIACCGYHGWQDWYIGTTTRNKGVPEEVSKLTIPFEFNNIESLKRIFAEYPGRVAAVIMEPVGVVESQDEFLEKVRTLTEKEGALLIFDEVVTGFRMSVGGAQQYFGVVPDIACFGKAIANGFPLSAVVGRKEIMELFDEVFFSFTFAGETVSLVAAKATITEIMDKNVINYLWEQGKKLKDGFNTLAKYYGVERYVECLGYPPRTVITFKDESGQESILLKSFFQQECIKRGLLFTACHNVCYSHTDYDIDYTLQVYRTVLEILADAIKSGDVLERIEGDLVQPVFRKP